MCKHKKQHEDGATFRDVASLPSLKQRHWSCVICGEPGSIGYILQHIKSSHRNEAERKEFGVGQASELEFEVLKRKFVQLKELKVELQCLR